MTRERLDHVLRAAASVTQEHWFVVLGSQAVLLPHADTPDERLIEPERLIERLRALDSARRPHGRLVACAERRAAEAAAP